MTNGLLPFSFYYLNMKYLRQSVFSHLSVLFTEHGNFGFKRGWINHSVGPLWVNDTWISSLLSRKQVRTSLSCLLTPFYLIRLPVTSLSLYFSLFLHTLKDIAAILHILHYRHYHD